MFQKALLMVFGLFLFFYMSGWGQKKTRQERITISGTHTLRKVFDIIYDQSGIQITYNNQVLNDREKVSLEITNSTIDDVLQQVLKGKNIVWVREEKFISIKSSVQKNNSQANRTDAGFNISGIVQSPDGKNLAGATVMIKGTGNGTASDNMGRFSLNNVAPNSKLTISYTGYISQEIVILNTSDLTIVMHPADNSLEETVVVAYGTTTKRGNTSAVTVVKGETIANLPNRSIDRSLQGQVPGLLITAGSGAPGGGTSNFVLRGVGTGADLRLMGGIVRQPLIVIDGVPTSSVNTVQYQTGSNQASYTNPLAQFNPDDIEAISILKDAAAIALYGSKASNGVVLISTKKGKIGKSSFALHHQTDIANPLTYSDKMLNQDEYLALLKEAYVASNPSQWTDAAIEADLKTKFPTYVNESGDKVFYSQPDWFDAIYRKSAITVTNEISNSGGGEKNQYYFSLGHTTQKGTVKHTGFDRIAVRYNFANQPVKWLNFGLNSTITYTSQNYLKSGSEEQSNSGNGFAYTISPLNPVRLQNNQYNLYPFVSSGLTYNNPVAELDYNINRTQSYRGLANFYAQANITRNVTIRTLLGADILFAQVKEKIDPRLSVSFNPPGVGLINQSDPFSSRIINTNTFQYSNTFNNSNTVELLFGQEAQIEKSAFFNGSKQGLSVPYLTDLSAASTISDLNGSESKSTLLSYFAQGNYNYMAKYYFSTSFRRDGSSKFGTKNQYGNYWSIGMGWVLSEEKFLKTDWVNFLKLRGSVGTSGNSASLSSTVRYDLVSPSALYNNTAAATITPGNPEVEWEKTFNHDIGLEFTLFGKALSGTVDWYYRRISDLLYSFMLPGTSGATSVMQNIGEMENKGWEIALQANLVKSPNFNWNLQANWSTNKNKLIKASSPLSVTQFVADKEGENFNSYYLVKWAAETRNRG